MSENFILPKPRIAEVETKKRENIVDVVAPEIIRCAVGILLTGSVSYGQYYSVTPESNINLTIIVSEESVEKLGSCKYFQKYNTARIVEGFKKGHYQHFSLKFEYKKIQVVCDFYDEKTWKNMVQYKTQSAYRWCNNNKKPIIDTACSFEGSEISTESIPKKIDASMVNEFPAYEVRDNKTYLYQPLTDALINPIILFDECELESTLVECRRLTTIRLDKTPRETGKTYSIVNTLSAKNKVSPEMIEEIG